MEINVEVIFEDWLEDRPHKLTMNDNREDGMITFYINDNRYRVELSKLESAIATLRFNAKGDK